MKPVCAPFNLTTFPVLLFTFLTIVSISATDLFSVRVTASRSRDNVRAASLTLPPDQPNQARITTAYGKLPMSFEVNRGQTDAQVKFLTRGDGYSLFLTASEAVLSLSKPVTGTKATASPAVKGTSPELKRRHVRQDVLRMRLVGANPAPDIYGVEELPGKSNYLIGNDPSQWHTDVAHYARVKYDGVYRGVDVVYYGNQRQLEYDFIVAPGVDPSAIALAFEGARSVDIDADGELVLRTGSGEVRQRKPFVYQEVGSERREVAGRYVKRSKHQVGFEIGEYDVRLPLVIDPVLVYSTYLGGTNEDQSFAIAVDAAGNVYTTGFTGGTTFPTTTGAYDPVFNGQADAFVTKLNASGSALIYSTYLGGTGSDQGRAIAVDGAGNAYVTGFANTSNLSGSYPFPTTPGSFDSSYNGNGDAFVVKLNPTGSGLLYSTFLGGSIGSETGYGIAVDGAGNAYITGTTTPPSGTTSNNFPVTSGAFDTTFNRWTDVFVTKLNASGSALIYSTYLGGTNSADSGYGIAVDTSGNAYVTGSTGSSNFPITSGAFDTTFSKVDAFVTKLNPTGSALVYSTYLGGIEGDEAYDIAVDAAGNAFVTGNTGSIDFPVTPGAFSTAYTGGDVFITKLNATGSGLVYSTYLSGASGTEYGYSLTIDAMGNAYVTGRTNSPNFPTTPDAVDATYSSSNDAFITKLNAAGSALVYSTYLGGAGDDYGYGIAVDIASNIYVTGFTTSSDFTTTAAAFDTSHNGLYDAFVAKLAQATPTPTPSPCPNIFLNPDAVADGTVGLIYSLNFIPAGGTAPYTFAASGNLPPGLSLSSSNGQLAGTPTMTGTYNFSITATDANSCTGTRPYTLVVSCPTITLSPSSLPVGTVGTVYDQFVIAGGGTAPYTFMTAGGLPPGITLDITGQLSGTPSASGSFTFSVTATDAFGCVGNVTYTVTINPAPTPTPTPTPPVTNGKIAFETFRDGNSEIYLMDADGSNPTRLTNDNSRDADPFFSPDGLRIVFPSRRDGNYEIYVMNVDGTNQIRLTSNSIDDFRPTFSPDGSKIAFHRNTGNSSEIYIMNADGTGEVRLTTNSSADDFPKWSPDGTRIIFQSNRDGDEDIYTMTLDGSNVVKLTNNNSRDWEASFSPDGSKIVFSSDRTGNTEIWVMNADGSQPINVSNSANTDGSCSWSADGRKILFISGRDGNTEIYVMNADGTGQTRLTINTVLENTPVSQPVR